MIIADSVPLLRRQRAELGTLAFVPTMGNLHAGHLALIRRARELADRVAVSIFVNPLQFGAGEDFDGYPRTPERDLEMLRGEGVELVFLPSVRDLYPRPMSEHTKVEVPAISDILCGASRPGHFVGVATIVCKLFNLVQPQIAVFGRKDYQQLMVIRRMVEDLAMPVRIEGLDTIREADGLAMSSRNGYLTPEERRIAPALYRTLGEMAQALKAGGEVGRIEADAVVRLAERGLRPDYLVVRRQQDLGIPGPQDRALVILAAAYLGRARLIDNREVRVS